MATEAKYREDKDLKFLANSEYEDLKTLASILMYDLDGKEQWSGGLKKSLIKKMDMYSSEKDLYLKSWKAIAAELQLFGGDTAVNLARGKGVLYEEILYDVAAKVGADFHAESSSINEIEEKVLLTLFKRQKLDLNDIEKIFQSLKDKGYLGLSSLRDKPLETIKNSLGMGAASTAGMFGSMLAGINIAKNAVRINPLFTLLTAPLTVKDITAPAYRVTIPAVCIIAMMRIKYANNFQDKF